MACAVTTPIIARILVHILSRNKQPQRREITDTERIDLVEGMMAIFTRARRRVLFSPNILNHDSS